MNESPNAMIERAIELAVVSHSGQVDKNGEAYILHPLRVMLAVRKHGGSIEQQAAAVLHDVIEDCGVSDEFLAARFPETVCDMVDALTRQENEDYEELVERAIRVQGAGLIKQADIQDNYGRLHLLQDDGTRLRLRQKYESALAIFQKAE
jgi:(p)ppGpp synthase/HD superfamily hydrolase